MDYGAKVGFLFLSTPSARRATAQLAALTAELEISIHALRKEGDIAQLLVYLSGRYFYPRPPQGGRLCR